MNDGLWLDALRQDIARTPDAGLRDWRKFVAGNMDRCPEARSAPFRRLMLALLNAEIARRLPRGG